MTEEPKNLRKPPQPKVTGNPLKCIKQYSNPGNDERQRAFSGNALDNSVTRRPYNSYDVVLNCLVVSVKH